jgi:glycosyltransferase involved in cell wall biosynthesis
MTVKQRVVETAYRMLAFPDPQIGWLSSAARAVSGQLSSGNFDAVVSTSYPFSAHLIARRALVGRNTPWIADLRDAWRDSPDHSSALRLALDAILERATLRRANAITTVSNPLVQLLKTHNPAIPVFEVLNAFDPDEWVDIPFARPTKFTLTYAGSLLQGLRDPEPLFDSLIELFRDGSMDRSNVEVIFYSKREEWLETAITQRGLTDVVTLKGYVDRREVLNAERSTSVNLLLLRNHPGETGVYTGKLFEYFGAGRPVLTIGGPEFSVVKELMPRVGGWYARTPGEIRTALTTLYQMHNNGSDVRLNPQATLQFSAIAMAQRFSEVLEIIGKTSATASKP